MLTTEQLSELKQLKDAGDPVAYYSYLRDRGVGYATLALGVASGATSGHAVADLGGIYAISYLKEKYRQHFGSEISGETLQAIKVGLMRSDFDVRDAEDNPQPGSATAEQIADYHYATFAELGIPQEAWTGDTLHRRLTDAVWCLTCGPEELGPSASAPVELIMEGLAALKGKFSAEEWAVFISDATFGKVFIDSICEYGASHPLELAIALTLSSVMAPVLTLATGGLLAATGLAPETLNTGLAVSLLMAIDERLTVAAAKKLVDSGANLLTNGLGSDTVAVFNAIGAQLPAACVAEFNAANFSSRAYEFIQYIRGAQLTGVVTAPVLESANLADLAKANATARLLLESGLPFVISWEGEPASSSIPEYSDYPPEYWRDREAWLRGLAADNLAEAITGTGALRYQDFVTGATTLTGTGPEKRIVFHADGYLGSTGTDVVYGGVGVDAFSGGSGTDQLYGGSGNDWLGYNAAGLGNESADEINSDGNVYDGGTGEDHIAGSVNKDTIVFREGDGSDTVFGNGGSDVLQLATAGAPTYFRVGQDLVIQLGADKVTMKGWYADTHTSVTSEQASRLGELQLGHFAEDGSFVVRETVTRDTLHAAGLLKTAGTPITGGGQLLIGDLDHYQETLVGTQGSDRLYASTSHNNIEGGDVLIGGRGNDLLYGSTGADKAVVHDGDGVDTFQGFGGADIVEFHGALDLNSPTTLFDRVMADLRITFADGTTFTIKNWDAEGDLMVLRNGSDGTLVGAEEISSRVQRFFGDGSDNVYEVSTSTGQKVYGSGGNDTLTGSDVVDLIDGGSGNDVLTGAGGEDQLWGQAGTDRLYGGDGNDKLYGGTDADILWGESGSDMLAGGDGDDQLYGGADTDELWGGAGADHMNGNAGDDKLYGEAGTDTLQGSSGRNVLSGGAGNDTFVAEGSRDEMWGGGDFDTYQLTPTGAGTEKLIFEDAGGGVVDLSAYKQAGIGISLLKASADQLILSTSQGERIVVNGWSNQSVSLVAGTQTWSYAEVQEELTAKYGYTYQNVYQATQFVAIVAGLSPTFQAAVALYGAAAVQDVFAQGAASLMATGTNQEGAPTYRWGWRAGLLSPEALAQGATYGSKVSLLEGGRNRSAVSVSIPTSVTDTTPVARADMWFDFWQQEDGSWAFAVIDAYSAETTTSVRNPDGSIAPTVEVNKVVNANDPATWTMLHGDRNSFDLLSASAGAPSANMLFAVEPEVQAATFEALLAAPTGYIVPVEPPEPLLTTLDMLRQLPPSIAFEVEPSVESVGQPEAVFTGALTKYVTTYEPANSADFQLLVGPSLSK